MSGCHSASDRALLLHVGGEALPAILSCGPRPAETGVVIVVGGPQYRVGSHRQFVLLARELARAGFACLRFDARGMGDAQGDVRTFETLSDDLGAAIAGLIEQVPGLRRVVLWGLCDGASATLLYMHERHDPRIAGLVLLNPWVRSEASQARTQVRHYYRDRLRQPEFWRKLMGGRIALNAVRELLANVRRAWTPEMASGPAAQAQPFQMRMAEAWRRFDGPILLLLSGNDYTAREFCDFTARSPAWQGLIERHNIERIELLDADHTCSSAEQRRAVEHHVVRWLHRTFDDVVQDVVQMKEHSR